MIEDNYIELRINYLKDVNNTFASNTEFFYSRFNQALKENELQNWYSSLSMANQTVFFEIFKKRVCDYFSVELLTEILNHLDDELVYQVFEALLYATKEMIKSNITLISLQKILSYDSIFEENNEIYQIIYSRLEENNILNFKNIEVEL